MSRDVHSCTHWLRPPELPPPPAFGLVINKEIIQISKSKPKKISIFCTFKLFSAEDLECGCWWGCACPGARTPPWRWPACSPCSSSGTRSPPPFPTTSQALSSRRSSRTTSLPGSGTTVHCKEPVAKIRNKNFQERNCGLRSQFLHSFFCERFIYSSDRSAYSAAGKLLQGRTWEYIYHSQTHECGNWEWGRAIPCLGIHKFKFLRSVSPVLTLWKFPYLLSCIPPPPMLISMVHLYSKRTWREIVRPQTDRPQNVLPRNVRPQNALV